MIRPSKDNTFCYYPFYAMVFKLYDNENLKAVAPCCMMHDTFDIKGNANSILTKEELKGLSPYDIFHHKKFDELRENLSNNKRDLRCDTCWKQEDKGIFSHRLYSSWPFPEQFNTELKEVDISLSNKCNLACRMCNTGSSHQIYEDIDKMKKLGILHLSRGVFDSHNLPKNVKDNYLIKWIYNNTDKIKIFKASGGEPLYDQQILNLLQKFVDDGNSKDTDLSLHTNAMLITDDIIDLMNKFKMQRHTISIDGVDSTYDYIRHKSNFLMLESNLKNWLKKSTNIYVVNINFVLSSLNLGNVVDFLEWVALMFHGKIGGNVFITEIRPHGRGTDIIHLPISYLKHVKKQIEDYVNEFEKFKIKKGGKQFHYEIDKLFSTIDYAIKHNRQNIRQLYNEIIVLDKTRNQSYKNYLNPSLISILETYEQSIS